LDLKLVEGNFPMSENPETYKKYLMPVLNKIK